jgi:hypothetical protein
MSAFLFAPFSFFFSLFFFKPRDFPRQRERLSYSAPGCRNVFQENYEQCTFECVRRDSLMSKGTGDRNSILCSLFRGPWGIVFLQERGGDHASTLKIMQVGGWQLRRCTDCHAVRAQPARDSHALLSDINVIHSNVWDRYYATYHVYNDVWWPFEFCPIMIID